MLRRSAGLKFVQLAAAVANPARQSAVAELEYEIAHNLRDSSMSIEKLQQLAATPICARAAWSSATRAYPLRCSGPGRSSAGSKVSRTLNPKPRNDCPALRLSRAAR
jgi:hypothetical protein